MDLLSSDFTDLALANSDTWTPVNLTLKKEYESKPSKYLTFY